VWGVFESEKDIHVIPMQDADHILPPHILDDFCVCHPEVIEIGEDGRLIISHNSIN